ncbi:MAG TPA: preprotein translocase subunit SecA [Verrucomicrobiota bacterium]|jgi:preprotein translocase subunit SecA|nr:MAG: preprotein translocase subunit SecA [Verrucomicrobia bacterium ADurb.Bin118]HPY30721.1 preprotein translocase subunit SecA [Verrucomicrobiota bacterium]HQB15774.1 preprotein translocase subunit SecA [Verrucomicrobiota bacterium]
MIGFIVKKIIGSKNDREVKRLRPLVARINEIEAGLQSLPDDALRQKTAEWKAQLTAITDPAELAKALDDLLPEAFAVVKNTCRRLTDRRAEVQVRGHAILWEMIPFDVQLIGGIALHQGKIAEMATGEGKTLVATMPVYLNALAGRGTHVVTVNDYLAARDSEWMGAIYTFLGLTVGCILHDQPPAVRRQQYYCDITYGTNAEFGFDYLRDNGMAIRKEEQVQRGHHYAIVDEVDSILIDEARTPLIISGPAVRTFDEQYPQWKQPVEAVVRAQERLCARFLSEAQALIQKLHPTDGSNPDNPEILEGEIGLLLYRVKMGQPKSAGLLRLLEDPENLRLMNRAELELHKDQKKVELYRQKEELFFAMDEKSHEADLTEKGRNFMSPKDPEAFMMPDITLALHEIDTAPDLDARQRMEAKTKLQQEFETKAQKIHAISQLLKAYCLYEKDVEYVVQDNKVIIVDEHTGRLMIGRRWSDGLHQAVEAKEGVEIERETQTLATITIQNYFRLYHKLAGMTGTAETEAGEFFDIYKLGVLVIPTNKPVARKDANDSVYKTKREKFAAVLNEIKTVHGQGRPILVGTVSVETSEQLSRLLQRERLVHSVLNAKYHQQEAEIVTRAGQRGAITIATNMAGRGTDIKLGPGIAELGGLHVLATERHEARRIDRQLRGRCARQGDPGSSHFFIALEDDLMRLFGSDRIVKYMEKMGLEEGQELEHPLLNRSIEQAQKRVEQHNFQIRKRTLEYDDVMNKQREVIYGFRNEIINAVDVRDRLMDIMEEVVLQKVEQLTTAEDDHRDWKVRALADWVNLNFPVGIPEGEIAKAAEAGTEAPVEGSLYAGLSPAQFGVCTFISDAVRRAYEVKISYEDPEALKTVERITILTAIDKLWQEHLYEMDSLRYSIGLRGYGQRDPLIEYKAEAYKIFEELMINIKSEICHNIFRSASSLMAYENFLANVPRQTLHQATSAFGAGAPAADQAKASDVVSEAAASVEKAKPVRTGPKVGRNDPCPCGSGKKYKHCCGR